MWLNRISQSNQLEICFHCILTTTTNIFCKGLNYFDYESHSITKIEENQLLMCWFSTIFQVLWETYTKALTAAREHSVSQLRDGLWAHPPPLSGRDAPDQGGSLLFWGLVHSSPFPGPYHSGRVVYSLPPSCLRIPQEIRCNKETDTISSDSLLTTKHVMKP